MFRRKSYRATKELNSPNYSSSSREPVAMGALLGVPPGHAQRPPPAPAPVEKKNEPSSKPAIPAVPPSIVPAETKRVLAVGKYVVMTADVENCDAVFVQGNLDGAIRAKRIVIMKGGCVRGKVECDEADVAGTFEGMYMTINRRLTLSSTARVGGTITYNRLSIHDGAILTGELIYKPVHRESDAPPAKITVPVTPSPTEENTGDPDDSDDVSSGIEEEHEQEPGYSESNTVWNTDGASPAPVTPKNDEPSKTQ